MTGHASKMRNSLLVSDIMIDGVMARLKSLLPGGIREMLWRIRHMPKRHAVGLLRIVNPVDWLKALRAYYDGYSGPVRPMSLSIRNYPRPLFMRSGTSDFAVFCQVFLHQQYARLPVHKPKTIVDAGANIGLTSLFFLHRYPDARIIAIEPDPENFYVAQQNLRPYSGRCTLIHGALWSRRMRLALQRNGGHWASQVTSDTSMNNEMVEAFPLQDIFRAYGLQTLDVLKMDIEGAEETVLREGKQTIFTNVGCCAVELHNDACVAAFQQAAEHFGFTSWRQGELTIARRHTANHIRLTGL